jgi:hypothetical protein
MKKNVFVGNIGSQLLVPCVRSKKGILNEKNTVGV